MPTSPFPVNETLTGVVLAYENKELIADRVLPRIPVSSKKYKYLEYPKGQLFTVPETRVGRKSEPNQPDFKGEEKTDKVDDRALLDFVPQSDIEEALENINPKSKSAEWLIRLIELDHEIKVAGKVFAAATYPVGNKETLAGTDQFSHADSKPLTTMLAALEVPLMRPNRVVFGSQAWTAFRQHPQVVEAVTGTGAKEGVASRQQVAELLEVDEVMVGKGHFNTAKKGQDANIQRVWGKHVALLYIDEMADTQNGITFGGSPQYKGRIAGDWQDQKPGVEGGWWVKVAEYIHEKIFAADLGYFIEDATA